MSTKIVKTLKFPGSSDEYQINARYINGQELPDKLPNPYAITVGSKSYDGSALVSITASDLGLASAMRFIGISSDYIEDGSTNSSIIVNGKIVTVKEGDVVLYTSKEFVWTGDVWRELGDGSSYKIVQTPVASPKTDGYSIEFIDTITQDEQGVVSLTKKSIPEASESNSGLMSAEMYDKVNNLTTDDFEAGEEIWIFDCGTSTTVI